MPRKSTSLAVGSLLIACCALGGPAAAQDSAAERLEKSNRHHELVSIPAANGRLVRALVVYPEVDKPVTAVVVIHENRGLNDWARSLTDQLAEAGYVAVAPDLLSGAGPNGGATESFATSNQARDAISELKPEQVTADLRATVDYARGLSASNDTVAVCGFCWGGGQAFRLAAAGVPISASFVFYGAAPDEATLAKLSVPVYGFYGGNDFRISGDVPATARKTKELGKSYEPVIYEGAGHGFMRSGEAKDASPADRKGREEAWKRWKELLSQLK
jgi:carboxymethylenebutenolidase